MAKLPKFMIASNNMIDPSVIYIYHSRLPRYIARVENKSFEIIDDIDSMVEYYNGDVSKVEGLFNRMRDWYKSYKIFDNDRNR